MVSKLKKYDALFILLLFAFFSASIYAMFVLPLRDEHFYVSTALRFINGDSMIVDEFHFTQFSALFQIPLVFLWTKLTGSVDGIIIFLRCTFLLICIVIAICGYSFLRKKGPCGLVWALVFCSPFPIYAISYHFVFAFSLTCTTFFLYGIHKTQKKRFYFFAGVFYAFCCIANPLFCILFFVYAVVCIICNTKNRKWREKKRSDNLYYTLNAFFSLKSLFLIFLGITAVAVVAVACFLLTKPDFTKIHRSIELMLASTEYSFNMVEKISVILKVFNQLFFRCAFILPVVLCFLFFDKKRTELKHRLFHIVCGTIMVILISIGLFYLPFNDTNYTGICFSVYIAPAIFFFFCYMLTVKRNKALFYCMWLPGMVAFFVFLFPSRSLLLSAGFVLLPSIVSGTVFLSDFLKEIKNDLTSDLNHKIKISKIMHILVSIVIVLQFMVQSFSLFAFNSAKTDKFSFDFYKDTISVSSGSMKGIKMSKSTFEDYTKSRIDIKYIWENIPEDGGILIISSEIWQYVDIQRPVAAYTTWQENINADLLREYYILNPDKIPQAIYIDKTKNISLMKQQLNLMFSYDEEQLQNGVFLRVNEINLFEGVENK